MGKTKSANLYATLNYGHTSNGYGALVLRIVECLEDGKYRYPNRLDNDLFVDDLAVTAQHNPGEIKPSDLYAIRVEFENAYGLEFYKVENMFKTLKYVKARMDKIDSEYGQARDFDDIAIRFARSLGIKTVIVNSNHPGDSICNTSFTGNMHEFHKYPITDLTWLVNHVLEHGNEK